MIRKDLCFVFDLDGTLVQPGENLSEEICKYLISIQKQGARIIIATGRSYKETQTIASQLQLQHYKGALILADGQYIIDYKEDKQITLPYLSIQAVKDIYNISNGHIKFIDFYTCQRQYRVFFSCLNVLFGKCLLNSLLKHNAQTLCPVTLKHIPMVKKIEKIVLYCRKDTVQESELLRRFEAAYINNERWEIKCLGVNKANGVKKILGDIADNVFVFGNDENDCCLFKTYINSYVLDNATESVKAKASHIITTSVKQIIQNIMEGDI